MAAKLKASAGGKKGSPAVSAATQGGPVSEQPSRPAKVRKTSAQLQRFLQEDERDHRSLVVAGSEAHHEAAKEERRRTIERAVTREY